MNVNVTRTFLSFEQNIVDQAHPPTTWNFRPGVSIVPGAGFDFAQGTYLVLTASLLPSQIVVIGAKDPGARTPDGGYVNGGTFTIEDL